MAHANADPLEDLIIDGRVRQHPFHMKSDVVTLTINLDTICANIITHVSTVYLGWEPLRSRYSGTAVAVTQSITTDITNMATLATWNCYNRLRLVAERYAPHVRNARMNHRAPSSNRIEFPSFISSMLQSIGPLRMTDGPHDILIIYAPPNGTMQNYGRGAPQAPLVMNHERLISNLRSVGVNVTQIDMNVTPGAFWTTCRVKIDEFGLHDYLGTVHPTHYVNEDVPRCAFLDPSLGAPPFEDLTLTVGYVDDKATLEALAAVAAPPNIPDGQNAQSAGRPTGALFDINYHGIRPAVAAAANTTGRPAGCYILGRGVSPIFSCYIAQHLTEYDIISVLRHRLTR